MDGTPSTPFRPEPRLPGVRIGRGARGWDLEKTAIGPGGSFLGGEENRLPQTPAPSPPAAPGPPDPCAQRHGSERRPWDRGGGGGAARAAAAPAPESHLLRPLLRGAARRSGQRVKRRAGRAPARGAAQRRSQISPRPALATAAAAGKLPQPGEEGGNARSGPLAGLQDLVSTARKLVRAESADPGAPGLGDSQPRATGVRPPTWPMLPPQTKPQPPPLDAPVGAGAQRGSVDQPLATRG
nr:uncharacterized protein LOC115854725 [Globicephala melas]